MQDLKTFLQLSAWGSVTQCKIFPIPYGTTQKIKRFWQLFFQLQEMPRGWGFLNRKQELTASWPVIRTGRCPNDLGQSLLDRPDISAASPARPNTQSKSSSISASRPLPEQSHFHYHQPTQMNTAHQGQSSQSRMKHRKMLQWLEQGIKFRVYVHI